MFLLLQASVPPTNKLFQVVWDGILAPFAELMEVFQIKCCRMCDGFVKTCLKGAECRFSNKLIRLVMFLICFPFVVSILSVLGFLLIIYSIFIGSIYLSILLILSALTSPYWLLKTLLTYLALLTLPLTQLLTCKCFRRSRILLGARKATELQIEKKRV